MFKWGKNKQKQQRVLTLVLSLCPMLTGMVGLKPLTLGWPGEWVTTMLLCSHINLNFKTMEQCALKKVNNCRISKCLLLGDICGQWPGAYPRVKHLKAWAGSGLAHKHYTRPENLDMDKCSSLLWKVITYRHKKFYNIGPWWS